MRSITEFISYNARTIRIHGEHCGPDTTAANLTRAIRNPSSIIFAKTTASRLWRFKAVRQSPRTHRTRSFRTGAGHVAFQSARLRSKVTRISWRRHQIVCRRLKFKAHASHGRSTYEHFGKFATVMVRAFRREVLTNN
jgi:hypothetical protein